MIVDLSALAGQEAGFEGLIKALELRDMRIIGVEGAAPGWTDSEVWGRPPIATNGRADRFVEMVEDEPEARRRRSRPRWCCAGRCGRDRPCSSSAAT